MKEMVVQVNLPTPDEGQRTNNPAHAPFLQLFCSSAWPRELTAYQSADFVIPDDCLEAGAEALAHCTGLVPCPDTLSCPTTSKTRPTQPPVFHAHLEGGADFVVGLYLQSDTLWFLPSLDHSLLLPGKPELPPYFALASDQTAFPPWRPGRGAGVFDSSGDGVVAPRSHTLLEAYMRLFARDQGKLVGSFNMAMIAYMMLYVDEDGLLDLNLLPDALKTSYTDLKEGKKRVPQWTLELKEALGVGEQGS